MYIKMNDYEIYGRPDEIVELIKLVVGDPCDAVRPEEPAPAPAPAPKKPRAKVDVGKIKALHKAGWTVPKIADEMRLSAPTVRKYLKED